MDLNHYLEQNVVHILLLNYHAIQMVAGDGVEPSYRAYETHILPLNYPAIYSKLFIISHSKHFFHILEALHIVNHSTSH